MTRLVIASLVAAVVLCVGAGAVYVSLNLPNGGSGEAVMEVVRGESARSVARKLKDEGVIISPLVFELALRLRGGHIMAGEYSLPRNLPVRQVVEKLARGEAIARPVTILEGYTAVQIAEALEEAGIVPAARFLSAAAKVASEGDWPVPAESLEGFLFPETYHFRKNVPARNVVRAMLETFFDRARTVLPENVVNDPGKLLKVVTLASIIEKETGASGERKLISSVFVNRLRKKMPLQSDPTVIYALPSFDGNLRKKDLSYDSPYNTYVRRGLPPGPISNPGLASIEAAQNPARTGYLYFVSMNDGTHHFSTNLREHNRAVARYQLKRK